jgi:hypothetical protein
MKEIIEKQKEYIKFLGQIINDNAHFLSIHHCGASQEEINEGKRLRDEISILEKQLEGKEFYEKIYIKSEADLPKEDKKIYFVQKRILSTVNYAGDYQTAEYAELSTSFYNESYKSFWMTYIDWYLKPIE